MSSIDYHEILRQADAAFPSSLDEAAAAAAVAGAVANAEEEGEGVDVGAEGGMDVDVDVDVDAGAGVGLEGEAHDGQLHGGEYQHEHEHHHQHEHEHLDPADGEFLLPEEQHNLHHAHTHTQLSDLPIASGGDSIEPQPSHGESSRAGAGGAEGGRVSRGALSVQEKRERQKAQNRKAAERSRQKKRTEQMALESNVQQMQNENQRLRARLAALVANRPSKSPALPEHDTTPAPSDPAPASSLPSLPAASPPAVAGTGIDYTYVTKLLNELSASKSILLDKTLELSRLLDGAPPQEASGGGDRDGSDERSVLRSELLAQWCRMVGIKVEGRGLEAMLRHLRGEKESLGTQRERVLRELEGRRAVRDAVAVVQGSEVGEAQQEVQEVPEAAETAEEREGSGVEGMQEEQEVQHELRQAEVRQEDGEVHGGDSGSMEDIRGWIDAAVNIWDQEGKASNNEGII